VGCVDDFRSSRLKQEKASTKDNKEPSWSFPVQNLLISSDRISERVFRGSLERDDEGKGHDGPGVG
jgi:hypothetical protein